jgi:RNA polymerase sigma factor (sigma-70 family)
MQSGSQEAFTTLYRYYSPRLYVNILRLVRDPLSTEEIVQELFTRIWQKRESQGMGENFEGYMYRIAQNLVHDFFRRLRRDRKLMERFNMLVQENYEPVEQALQLQQTSAILRQAIAQLSPQQKKVYELVKIDGHTYKKAAEVMSISPYTVKEYLVAANKIIRTYIINHGDEALMVGMFLFGVYR